MGYRSDVVIVVKNQHLSDDSVIYHENLMKPENVTVEGDWSLIHFNWIKWYEAYPEVATVMDWLNNLPPEDYYFYRVGEESGDIEYQGTATDDDDCPFFVEHESYISFGLVKTDIRLSAAIRVIEQAIDLENREDLTLWNYLCEQVDAYRITVKN